jgi:hypothetical protein
MAPIAVIEFLWRLGPLGLLATSIAVLVALFIVSLLHHIFFGVPYPKGVELIREPAGAKAFSLRTRLAYYTDCRALYEEAWNKVSNFQ